MYDNTTYTSGKPREFDIGISLSPLSILTAAGFALVIFSTFLDFTPINAQSWRAGGVGLPVMLSCMVGCVLALRKNYFSAFFIGIFAAFFLTHEIIIIYDSKAIELGQELKPDGWFRSVIVVYQDALQTGFGAFWGMIGAMLASIVPLIGMAAEVRRKNLEAGSMSKKDSQRDAAFQSAENWAGAEQISANDQPEEVAAKAGQRPEESTEWADQFFDEDESEPDDTEDSDDTKQV